MVEKKTLGIVAGIAAMFGAGYLAYYYLTQNAKGTPSDIPTTPKNFRVNVDTKTGLVTLTWSPPSSGNEKGYVIYRRYYAVQYSDPIATLPKDTYSFLDYPGILSHYYSIAAYNDAGESARSNEIEAWIPNTPPSPPPSPP